MGGPCYINPDSNSTSINPWSWNNKANLLYIDQPVQKSFSYGVLFNGTLDQVTGIYTPTGFSSGIPFTPNSTTLVGTFPSQLTTQTANTPYKLDMLFTNLRKHGSTTMLSFIEYRTDLNLRNG